MLSHGPLSGMPLASIPRWPRTRVVVVPCQPRAVLQQQPRTPAVAVLEDETHVSVVAARVDPATAMLVFSSGARVCRVDVGARSNPVDAVKRGPARVECYRQSSAVDATLPELYVETTRDWPTAVDATDIVQPNVAKGEIRVTLDEC